MRNALSFLVVPAIWILSAAACWSACRFRRVNATLVPCFIIAGLPLLLAGLPLPLPDVLQVALGYALMVYVTMKYLGVSLIPDGLLIPFVTKLIGAGTLFVFEHFIAR